MTKFCISCGTPLNEGARFCGSCGAPVAEAAEAIRTPTPDAGAAIPPPPAPIAPQPIPEPIPEPMAAEQPMEQPTAHVYAETAPEIDEISIAERSGPNWLLIGGGAGIFLLLLLYYFIFIRDDVATAPIAPEKKVETKAEIKETQFFAVADANIRDKATTVGSAITGKLTRGLSATGKVIVGEDGTTSWLELSEGKGFIAMSNLSEEEPPKIVKLLGDKAWTATKQLDLLSSPSASATILDRISVGTALTLYGLTANDFIEVKLKKGGVGYLAGGAKLLEEVAVTAKPIAVSFNPASCEFSGELAAEFEKVTAKARAAYDSINKNDALSDAEREKALAGYEGKSYYLKLNRSFNGVTITAVGQHYESSSLYFAETPDKVLAAFKQAGYKIGRDGQFANTEIFAGIGATAGEGRTYGKTDLSCGV
jgi:hypothetical protein